MSITNPNPRKKQVSQVRFLKKIMTHLFAKKTRHPMPSSATENAMTHIVSSKQEILPPIFWKGSVSGNFQVDSQELIIYFYVSRSASRAQTLKQEVSAVGGSVEVLRLVGWDFSNPCVVLEVNATSKETWECKQIETEGIREPFGYVVLSSSYVPGVVNSFSVPHKELYSSSVRFQVDENSVCVRLK